MRKRSLSALMSAVAAVVLSTVALAGTAFASEATLGFDADPLSSSVPMRFSASAITPQAVNPAVQSGVYAFACAEDGSSEYTLVIKKGADEPTGYGIVLSDWHKDTDAHKAIDITDYNNVNKDGGIATPTRWDTATGTTAESWPWRFDENFRTSITKVVVLDGVTVPSAYYMFAGLVNVREFDLSGMDTTNIAKKKYYGTTYADPYDNNYMFGKFGATTANQKPSSIVEKIITGENWDMPTLFGFFNYSKNNMPGTTFYFTARDNTIVSRSQYYNSSSTTRPVVISGSGSRRTASSIFTTRARTPARPTRRRITRPATETSTRRSLRTPSALASSLSMWRAMCRTPLIATRRRRSLGR